MPLFKQGDMFDAPGIHIVTSHSHLSQDNTLVMGLGAAAAMKSRYPDAPRIFGAMVKDYCGHLGTYGLMLYGRMGILQARCDFNDRVDAGLVIYGLQILKAIAEGPRSVVYNLTHPGMAYGGAMNPEIETLLKSLPDNMHIWTR